MDHFVGFDALLRLTLGRGRTVHLSGPAGFRGNVAGKLAEQITRRSPGQRLAYVADAADTLENQAAILSLAESADHLFIEAAFLEADREQALAKRHLTARRAGWLAGRGGAAHGVPLFAPVRGPRSGTPEGGGRGLGSGAGGTGGKPMIQAENAAVQSETVFHTVRGAVHRVRRIVPPDIREGLAPIVFLHEGLGCIEVWKDVPEAVCAGSGRRGLVYDRRGYGESADDPNPVWPKDYLITETGYLPPLLDALGIERAVLMGHSDGASLALLAAALAPERVAGVVSEAAHIFVEEITLAGIRQAVAAYESAGLREKLARFLGPRTDSVFRRWADTWLSAEFRDWNIEAYLPRIACPLLVLQGAGDPYGTPAQVEGIARGVSGPVETALLPNCGHIPHFQAPEATLSRTLDFLDSLD